MERTVDQKTQRLTAQVHGVVQGVGFRMFVLREARRLRVVGYTRNCPDGTVETVAEGAVEKLRELEACLRRGPAAARVDRVRSEWTPATGEFTGFDVA